MQQRTKEVLSEDVISLSPFARELYKQVRGKAKKLDEIQKIEERMKEKGFKITQEQSEKLKQKQNLTESVLYALETFEVYKKTEFAAIQQKQKEEEERAKRLEEE